MLKSRR
jgi:Transposase DDE domain